MPNLAQVIWKTHCQPFLLLYKSETEVDFSFVIWDLWPAGWCFFFCIKKESSSNYNFCQIAHGKYVTMWIQKTNKQMRSGFSFFVKTRHDKFSAKIVKQLWREIQNFLTPRLRWQWGRRRRWRHLVVRIWFLSIHIGQFFESWAKIVEVVKLKISITGSWVEWRQRTARVTVTFVSVMP